MSMVQFGEFWIEANSSETLDHFRQVVEDGARIPALAHWQGRDGLRDHYLLTENGKRHPDYITDYVVALNARIIVPYDGA